MPPANLVHLPNGQNLTITPVFGGLFFKSSDLLHAHSPFPPGWTVVLNSEDGVEAELQEQQHRDEGEESGPPRHVHRFRRPTLHGDHLYISSISNPSSSEYKAAASPTRQIAMMLWATLYWYFHQPEPMLQLTNTACKNTAEAGRPKGEWRININREGIFKGKVVLPKLERMGLVASEDSTVGCAQENSPEGWTRMFVSRTTFWQLDPRIYLFTLSPLSSSPFPSGSPYPSRPSSPIHGNEHRREQPTEQASPGLWSPAAHGPFYSSSHLPTYYPPPPAQYVITNHVRHPVRPKPPRQGEVFYTRYIPSVGQYLSFRVASCSSKPLCHRGPTSTAVSTPNRNSAGPASESATTSMGSLTGGMLDSEYLHKWMNDARVSHFWGEAGPQEHQEQFLRKCLQSKNSFPVIGCWDGKPFGYFELYWVKEDNLGKYLPIVGDYDRAFHCLIGEQEFRGAHRVKIWLSALVHYCWLADNRTERVLLEPRVDNERFAHYLQEAGFYKEREVSLPHKQSNLFQINRDVWRGPVL